MVLAVGSRQVRSSTATPTLDHTASLSLIPPLLALCAVLLVGMIVAGALRYRNDGGWEVGPVSAFGFPILATAVAASTYLYLLSPALSLVESLTSPLLQLPVVYGGTIVLGAASKHQQWRYGLVGLAFVASALTMMLRGGGLDFRLFAYLVVLFALVGFVVGYLTS